MLFPSGRHRADLWTPGVFIVRQACCESWRCKSSTGYDDRNREPMARACLSRGDLLFDYVIVFAVGFVRSGVIHFIIRVRSDGQPIIQAQVMSRSPRKTIPNWR
jgi:hypothetical protein